MTDLRDYLVNKSILLAQKIKICHRTFLQDRQLKLLVTHRQVEVIFLLVHSYAKKICRKAIETQMGFSGDSKYWGLQVQSIHKTSINSERRETFHLQ